MNEFFLWLILLTFLILMIELMYILLLQSMIMYWKLVIMLFFDIKVHPTSVLYCLETPNFAYGTSCDEHWKLILHHCNLYIDLHKPHAIYFHAYIKLMCRYILGSCLVLQVGHWLVYFAVSSHLRSLIRTYWYKTGTDFSHMRAIPVKNWPNPSTPK